MLWVEVLWKLEMKAASLKNIIKSKRAAGRQRDRAIIDILERTLLEKEEIEFNIYSEGHYKEEPNGKMIWL